MEKIITSQEFESYLSCEEIVYKELIKADVDTLSYDIIFFIGFEYWRTIYTIGIGDHIVENYGYIDNGIILREVKPRQRVVIDYIEVEDD